MTTIRRFEDLDAWVSARQLCRAVYRVSKDGRLAADFGLTNQIRRAAVSVMSNIAEGFESRTTPMFIEFLGRAKGSAGEVRAQLYVALDAEYISPDQFAEFSTMAANTSSCIGGLMRHLEKNRKIYPFRGTMIAPD